MKEYVAQTGGRYTYSDDVINLQELALGLTALFGECANFVISGCRVQGQEIMPGYVWINGKIRYFEGCPDAVLPYYIYETNRYEAVTYANEVNKCGRICYLCSGGTSVPQTRDTVTGELPGFIELREEYAPRLADQFFGRYSILSDSPFRSQTVKKDLVLMGAFTGQKEISSKTGVSVEGANGYVIRNLVREGGNASTGVYLNGLPVIEIIFCGDGSIRFMKADKELARINGEGFSCAAFIGEKVYCGSLVLDNEHLYNCMDATDAGAVKVNYHGYAGGGAKYRDFAVYNGKEGALPLLEVCGKTAMCRVNGAFEVNSGGKGVDLCHIAYRKDSKELVNVVSWRDSGKEVIGHVGFDKPTDFNFSIKNYLGDIVLLPKGSVNVVGTFKIGGVAIGDIYVAQKTFTDALEKKVDAEKGKRLSTEDFTTDYKKKLDNITSSGLGSGGDGFVTARDVEEALKLKLSADRNLLDVSDKGVARENLDVYSKTEAGGMFLKVSGKLLELVSLSPDEINSLTAEEAAALKAQKQAAVRKNIHAEEKGTGALKLDKASNLSDVTDKGKARQNLHVYSVEEIDKMLAGKLGTDSAYGGVTFTKEMRDKLEGITAGNFAYTDADGKSHAQVQGYALVGDVAKELKKKAAFLLEGYSSEQKNLIAANLGVYTKDVADGRFASVENLLQDYITFLVKSGKTTGEAQKTLRDRLSVLSTEETEKNYLRRDKKLSDLALDTLEAKQQACRALGAAYAPDYQPLLTDTGWQQMSNSGSATDTRRLFVRQIGSVVSIQGVIRTSQRDGSNWGGTIALLPNSIQPPHYSVRCTATDWNEDTKYNRGASFVIDGNSRAVKIYESGMGNAEVELNFTYMV